MIIPAIVLSLIFGSLGFIVTKNNAKYLLSGYNTMSEAQRAKMDLDGYLHFFKRFHIVLGISLLVITLLLSAFNNNWASGFMIMFPLISYLYLIIKGNSFYKDAKAQKLANYFGCGILIVVIGIVGTLEFAGNKNNDLKFTQEVLEINGLYGLKIDKKNILKIALVHELPPIAYRSNGYAAGDYAKGSFKAKNGKTIKLFVNKSVKPILWFETAQGDIYYNSEDEDMNRLYKKIMQWRGLY